MSETPKELPDPKTAAQNTVASAASDVLNKTMTIEQLKKLQVEGVAVEEKSPTAVAGDVFKKTMTPEQLKELKRDGIKPNM